MSTTTTNMSLPVPSVGDTDYPTSNASAMTLIDAHDHSTGKGIQIAAGGLASNAVTTAKILDANVTTAKIADANVTLAKLAADALAFAIPAGAVLPYAGGTAPSGFLLCYGQAVSRATYSALFTAISTVFGTGDGSTTFNLPDLRGRVAAGDDDMGGSAASRLTSTYFGANASTLGAVGGSESHTLTTAQIPAHTHTITGTSDGGPGGQPVQGAANSNVTYTTNSTGGGGAHNNVQPTLILTYIIKT